MTPQEKNWLNLFGQYSQEGTTWHALTTVYSLDLEVIRAYKFTRQFSSNAEGSTIYHKNTYYLAEDNINEKSWEIEKEKCNQSDGVVHPEAPTMRAIGFGNDTSIWVAKQSKYIDNFGSEVFIEQPGDWRYGIIPVYQDREFARIVVIKENKGYFPKNIALTPVTNLSRTWKAKHTKMTPHLQEEIEEDIVTGIDFDVASKETKIYCFPEKIVLKLPKKITLGQEFEIVVGKQTSETQFKQVKSQYDAKGQFTGLVSSELELNNSLNFD
jgi:hypothetical protein